MHGYVPNLSANFYFVSLAEIIFFRMLLIALRLF